MAAKTYHYTNLSLMDIRGENWKDIPGLVGYFVISNYGRVKRLEYEMQYKNGAFYTKEERIIKPGIVKQPNHLKGDHTFLLVNRVTLGGVKHNLTVARLVHHCFVSPFDLSDQSVKIICKDSDGFNIRPANLLMATLSEKQQRAFDLGRAESPLAKLDERTKEKVVKARLLANRKEVSQYNPDGTWVATFSSIVVAERATGIFATSIGQSALDTA